MRDLRPPEPPPPGGEGADSDIEEVACHMLPTPTSYCFQVGRTYRHLPSARGSLASSSFDWGASSFTSTLDVDAIKVSSPSPAKAPLTTIAPDWEEAVLPPVVLPGPQPALPKLEPPLDSSSESESENCSASDSESGSNEGSSSSSCSSLESGSSSDNEETSKIRPRGGRSSSRSRVRASPLLPPSQSCASPPRRPASSLRRARQASGSRRHSSILLKKSSLLCQKNLDHGSMNPSEGNVFVSSPERLEEESFSKFDKMPEILHQPSHTSPVPRLGERSHKRRPGLARQDLDEQQGQGSSSEEMPQLFEFSEDPVMPVLVTEPVTELSRAISSIRGPERLDELDLGDIISDLANSNDSDDSCMIVDPPPIILEQKPAANPDDEDTKYKHKKNMIFGIYGKSHEKVGSHKMVVETKSIFDVDESEGSMAAKPSSGESSGSESESGESSSSSSSCSEPFSPMAVEEPEPMEEVKPLSDPPSSLESSELSDSDSSSSGSSTPPPTLALAVPASPPPPPPARHRDPKPFRRQGRPKGSKNKKKVECASQTDFSAISDPHVPCGATPPMLIGFGMEPSKLNRGRPRKNPPMLEPEIGTLARLKEEDDEESLTHSDENPSKTGKKKKGKLSVLFAAAKNWQKQQEKSTKTSEDTVYDFKEDEGDASDDPTEGLCDNTKHSKADKLKFLKVRAKHKDHKKWKQNQKVEKSHKHKNIHSHHHISERKKMKKQKKIVISSGEEEEQQRTDVKQRKSHKTKKLKKEEVISDIEEPQRLKKTVVKREQQPMEIQQGPVFELFGTSNNFAEAGSAPGLIFSQKFCSLIPETFWKKDQPSLLKLIEEPAMKSEPSNPPQDQKGTTFTTKASVKEMPSTGSAQSFPPAFVPKNQVQQMASLLASLDSFEKNPKKSSKKEGKKKEKASKKEREAKKAQEDLIRRAAYETCYETQSEDEEGGVGKKKKKVWKSKHKNVIDPVFLGELEHLIQDVSCCQLEVKLSTDLWPGRPSDCVPSIFRRRKIHTPTKRKKEAGTKVTKRTKTPKQPTQTAVAVLDLTESDEQRLPLKKRHHHLQGEGKEVKDAEKKTMGTLQVKSPEKICREFRINNKVRGEDPGDSCLSPSKMVQADSRSLGNSGVRVGQEKLVKKPTAADMIVEKLGIQIKKETLEINNESKSGRASKVSDRSTRRISKDVDFTKPDAGPSSRNSLATQVMLGSVKHEQSSFNEFSFMDNIQDCIEKYTNVPISEKSKAKLAQSSSQHSKASPNLNPQFHQKQRQRVVAPDRPGKGAKVISPIPLLSSPEPDITINSGRDSSLSQSSVSSESCSIINLDPEPDQVSGKVSSSTCRVGRASSRQDLHSHLWKQEEVPPSLPQQSTSSSMTAKSAAYRSLVSDTMRKRGMDPTARPLPPSTKPLPTEPIRRVDLAQGFHHKPLDKGGRPLSGQECLIRKVPQAIVAPFRRNPPEPSQVPVVPIHRASIAAHTSSSAADALLTATTSLTAVLPPLPPTPTPPTLALHTPTPPTPTPDTPTRPAPTTPTPTLPTPTPPTPTPPTPTPPTPTPPPSQPSPAPVLSPPKESPVPPSPLSQKKPSGGKGKEEFGRKPPLAPSTPQPKTRAQLEQEAKLENAKKEANIKRCKVAVERLDESISRRALLGAESLEKQVENLHVTDDEIIEQKRTITKTECEKSSINANYLEQTLCVTKQLEVLERRRRDLKLVSGEPIGKILEKKDDENRIEGSPAKPTLAEQKKDNDSQSNLGKIADPTKLTQSSTAVLRNENTTEAEELAKLEKQRDFVKKRRRKTNKTGFPSSSKKRRRIEAEKVEQVDKVPASPQAATSKAKDLSKTSEADEGKSSSRYEATVSEVLPSEQVDIRQTSTGRPLRECRERLEEKPVEEQEPATDRGKKRMGDLGRGRGRPPKRQKMKLSRSAFQRSNSSSMDPSPASSDVESVDLRNYLDDESDGDSLNVLPSSEDNFLSPSVAESSEFHAEEKRKKVKPANLLKKNFLDAGLFSYDFKSKTDNKGAADNCIRGKGIMYRAEEHPFGLLPPPYYCGRQLRQKREDLTLPYDLWHLHSTDSLPTRHIVASWNYKKIKNNIFAVDGKFMQSFETPACHCKRALNDSEPGCSDKCLNRMTYTECDPDSCPVADRCSNMSIQKHDSITNLLNRFMTPHKGWGVKTKAKIAKDTFIMEYLGEVVTDKEFKQRMHTDYKQDTHHYCLHVGEGMVIDGHRMGGECRFVNHSCKPNCEMQKWSVNGLYRMALFSSREIQPHEELNYDYNFSLFNEGQGQTCHCGNEECRGIIGGKGRKNAAKTPIKAAKAKEKRLEESKKEGKVTVERAEEIKSKTEEIRNHFPPLKPMSVTQKAFCRTHSVLLLRNLDKIQRLREIFLSRGQKSAISVAPRPPQKQQVEKKKQEALQQQQPTASYSEEVFKAGLAALTTARSVTTRRLASAQENPDVAKVIQVTNCFQQILRGLEEIKISDGKSIKSNLDNVPSKEDLPQYHLKISEPIDFSIIERSLSSGSYHSVAHIDQDILLLFQNTLRFYACSSEEGKQVNRLKARYLELCHGQKQALKEVVGEEGVKCLSRPVLSPTSDEEDVINCPCGQLKDEGVMVQCDSCHCWQHTDCVAGDKDPALLGDFTCQACSGHSPNFRIPLVPQPEFASPGELHYVSMDREDGLHLTLGMTVYVLRAFKEKPGADCRDRAEGTTGVPQHKIILGPGGIPHKSISPIKGPSKEATAMLSGNYPTYKTVNKDNVATGDMDIFRVERLWINEATGFKFAFGFHYLRPHETFHEPSRRFFDNEVFRVPLYEVLPLDTIWGECWVTDPAAFCRGRPMRAREEDVYICEYRVDKTARLFNKISKPKYPTCTKAYAFNHFDLKLRVTRAYAPHEVPDKFKTARGREGAKDSPGGSRDHTPEAREEARLRKQTKHKQATQAKEINKVRACAPVEPVLQRLLAAQGDPSPEDASGLLQNCNKRRNRLPASTIT